MHDYMIVILELDIGLFGSDKTDYIATVKCAKCGAEMPEWEILPNELESEP